MRVLRVDPEEPDLELIREAASVIRSGGLVIFPTETVYGLACNALDPSAVRKVFAAKQRPISAALPIQVGDKSSLAEVADELSGVALRLAERYMPGPITLIVRRNGRIPDVVTAGAETVGVRIPDNRIALALLKEVGGPIVATSANISGCSDPTSADEAVSQIGEHVDIVLDAGQSEHGVASTVVDTTVNPPRVLRKGAISVEDIRQVVGEVIE
jgi:L-threonylcarbamoyladenylate synthase